MPHISSCPASNGGSGECNCTASDIPTNETGKTVQDKIDEFDSLVPGSILLSTTYNKDAVDGILLCTQYQV